MGGRSRLEPGFSQLVCLYQKLSPEGHCCPRSTTLLLSHLCASFAQHDDAGAVLWQWPPLLPSNELLCDAEIWFQDPSHLHGLFLLLSLSSKMPHAPPQSTHFVLNQSFLQYIKVWSCSFGFQLCFLHLRCEDTASTALSLSLSFAWQPIIHSEAVSNSSAWETPPKMNCIVLTSQAFTALEASGGKDGSVFQVYLFL